MPCKKCTLNFKKQHSEENLNKTGYCQIIASAIWFHVFQSNLAHLFSRRFILSRINPQGFALIFLNIF